MTIIYYDADNDKIYICTEEKTKCIDVTDPNIMTHIPNDDIVYVGSAHFITKQQFGSWLKGDFVFETPQTEVNRFSGLLSNNVNPVSQSISNPDNHPIGRKRYYICSATPGTVILEDIKTDRFPTGITLHGKYHFIPIDEIGQDVLDESRFYQYALAKGKIKVVDNDFVKANQHKRKNASPTDAALDAILVPVGRRAEDVAASGGIRGGMGSDVIEIEVE